MILVRLGKRVPQTCSEGKFAGMHVNSSSGGIGIDKDTSSRLAANVHRARRTVETDMAFSFSGLV